jgi:hypothetical protein
MFPKSGARMETDAHSRALLNLSFGVHSKGALPPGPPSWSPLGERCPVPRTFSTHLAGWYERKGMNVNGKNIN